MRPTRHPRSTSTSSSGFTQTGAAGFGQPARRPAASSTSTGPTSAPSGPTPLPPDPVYSAAAGPGGTIDQSTALTTAGLTGDRDRTLLDYGYNVQYDASGQPITNTLTFDPTNVFSRAAQLRKRWMEARSGTQNGMAAAGQLNSGAYGRAQRQNNYGESQQTDAEIKGLTAFLARNGSQISGAQIAGETAKGTAFGDRVTRAATNPLYDPTRPAMAPGGAGIADYNARDYTTKVDRAKGGEWHIFKDGRKPVFVRYK